MWIANEKFKEFHRAVLKGEVGRLSRLFAELFHPDNQVSKNLTICPQCQKKLERKMHPYLEYFVQACPDCHGAWISPDVSAKVRDLFVSQIMQSSHRQKISRILLSFAAGLLIMILLTHGSAAIKKLSGGDLGVYSGQVFWPVYQFQPLPLLTEVNTTIGNTDERRYLAEIVKLLEAGASNRINLDQALKKTRGTESVSAIFDIYRKKHEDVLMKLRVLYVPKKLFQFHKALQKAAEAQLAFYGAFAEAKGRQSQLTINQWSRHPALRVCNQELLKAYDLLTKQYPQMENAVKQSIESRLCWFDIV